MYTCVNVRFYFQSPHTKVCTRNLDINDKYYSFFSPFSVFSCRAENKWFLSIWRFTYSCVWVVKELAVHLLYKQVYKNNLNASLNTLHIYWPRIFSSFDAAESALSEILPQYERREGQMTFSHKNSLCRLFLHPWVEGKRQLGAE